MVIGLRGRHSAIQDLHVLAALHDGLGVDLYVLEPVVLDVDEGVDHLGEEGEQLLLAEVPLLLEPARDEVSEGALRALHEDVDLVIVGAELLALNFAERVEVEDVRVAGELADPVLELAEAFLHEEVVGEGEDLEQTVGFAASHERDWPEMGKLEVLDGFGGRQGKGGLLVSHPK